MVMQLTAFLTASAGAIVFECGSATGAAHVDIEKIAVMAAKRVV